MFNTITNFVLRDISDKMSKLMSSTKEAHRKRTRDHERMAPGDA